MSRLLGALVVVVLLAGLALAQAPPSGGQMPIGAQPGSSSTGSAPPGGMGGMMGGMMCPMMGSGMGMGMMGGGTGMMAGPSDPKMLGRMLQMRADMMRAMADVLAKHGKALEEGK
jgi:hypothetical protein